MSLKKLISKNVSSTNNADSLVGYSGLKEEATNKPNPVKLKSWKKKVQQIVKTEFDYISNLFDVLDIAGLHHGRRQEDGEGSEDMEILNIPEKKNAKKKNASKKKSPAPSKSKPFPTTAEGLEKELEELKGTTVNYHQRLRKKGLQIRLTKKKRKESIKQSKKLKITVNGTAKQIKPVLNNDGHVVSNKFDFADSESKKDNKKKFISMTNKMNTEHNGKVLRNENSPLDEQSHIKDSLNNNETKKTLKRNNSIDIRAVDSSSQKKVKKENTELDNDLKDEIISKRKFASNQGPLFNKDNKMVFSKVYIPENKNNRFKKKKVEKDPQKILQRIKEDKKKILEIQKEDSDKAVAIKEKQKWSAALKRASGEKVKDDPELLKKTIMKEKNKKIRSQKKWQARTERVEKDKEDRQKKRTENIKARSTEKKKRKLKKAIKKGSFVKL